MLREFCDAVERQDGGRFANLFCDDGVYHDVFYEKFTVAGVLLDSPKSSHMRGLALN